MSHTDNLRPGEDQARKFLLPPGEEMEAFDEILYTHEAIFQVINNSELDDTTKNTLYRLEKHLNHHTWLLSGRIGLILRS
jgi:hypothetical protein